MRMRRLAHDLVVLEEPARSMIRKLASRVWLWALQAFAGAILILIILAAIYTGMSANP